MQTSYRHFRSVKARVAGVCAAAFVTFALLQSVGALFQSAGETQLAKAKGGTTRVASVR